MDVIGVEEPGADIDLVSVALGRGHTPAWPVQGLQNLRVSTVKVPPERAGVRNEHSPSTGGDTFPARHYNTAGSHSTEVSAMKTRDYYVTLGVPRTETTAGIRSAFRELAKRHHPDRSGAEGNETFREVLEAYRVLSDAALRRHYDEGLRRRAEAPEPLVIRRASAEALTDEPVPLFGRADEARPSFDAMFDRLVRNFTRIGVPKAERLEPLHCDVLLSPDEAATGGVLPIDVPVFEPCSECGGSGSTWLFPCLHCGQSGMVEDAVTVRLEIPPMVRGGTVIDLPLEGLGVSNFRLRIFIHIDR
jgi:DnaJ-class molecular chaperone